MSTRPQDNSMLCICPSKVLLNLVTVFGPDVSLMMDQIASIGLVFLERAGGRKEEKEGQVHTKVTEGL